MTSSKTKGIPHGLVLFGAGMLLALVPARAQLTAPPPGAGDALSTNLRTLAQNPRSLTALMGAGRAALDLGDPQAALTFFARAEMLSPSDGRIKMWIGSALVQLEQPRSALKFFKDAVDMGVPEADVAKDRGLAYDIAGETRQAQRDYRLVLQRGADPEVTRRLALSLAIGGEREAALRLLEDQLLVRDRAAERTKAFVLALTGDAAGANRAAASAMPYGQGAAMAPFLARLPSLSPSERALAVHLGHFPGDGRTSGGSYAAAQPGPVAPVTDAGRPDSGQASLARRVQLPEPVSTAPRRRPGSETQTASSRPSPKPSSSQARPRVEPPPAPWSWGTTSSASSRPARREPDKPATSTVQLPSAPLSTEPARIVRAQPQPTTIPPVRTEPPAAAQVQPATPTTTAEARPQPAGPPNEPQAAPLVQFTLPPSEPARTAEAEPQPTVTHSSATDTPAPAETAAPASQDSAAVTEPAPGPGFSLGTEPAPAPTPTESARLADLAAAVATVAEPKPSPPPAAKPRPAAKKPTAAPSARTAAAASAPAKKPATPAPPAEPSRVWVQVAGGADKAALPRAFARLKEKAPKLLGARTAWTAPLSATNRLLVGPFASGKEAQALVNELAKLDLSAFTWTSAKGEKIEKLPAK